MAINETVAIEMSDVLADECTKRNITYRSWMSFTKRNTFFWATSPYHTSLRPVLNNVIPGEAELEEAKEFVANLRSGSLKPFYAQNKTNRYSLSKLAKDAWTITLEIPLRFKLSDVKRRVFYGTAQTLRLRNIKLFFLSLWRAWRGYDDFDDIAGKEIVFYPMHFEPEAVLFYMAYFFDNQPSIIENLLKCLDVNQILVVKEHPQQSGTLLEEQYRKIKRRYPNLVYVRSEEPTVKVLKASDVIVTLGSTAGFEGLALNKKIINLSRVFYDSFESVNNCKSFSEVYDLLRKNKSFNAPGDFVFFIARMLKYVKRGNPFFHKELLSAENVNAIKTAIEDELALQD